ncbi:hypothetical protein GCM10027052_27500 [Parafrigoribacterium mesophilum]
MMSVSTTTRTSDRALSPTEQSVQTYTDCMTETIRKIEMLRDLHELLDQQRNRADDSVHE